MYDDFIQKAKKLSLVGRRIFGNCPKYKYLGIEGLFKGFFFIFVYKDFVLREILDYIREHMGQDR